MSSTLRSPRGTPKCSSSWLFIILKVREDTSSDPRISSSTFGTRTGKDSFAVRGEFQSQQHREWVRKHSTRTAVVVRKHVLYCNNLSRIPQVS